MYLIQEIFHYIRVVIHGSQVQRCQTMGVNQSDAGDGRILSYKQLDDPQGAYCACQMKCSTSIMFLV